MQVKKGNMWLGVIFIVIAIVLAIVIFVLPNLAGGGQSYNVVCDVKVSRPFGQTEISRTDCRRTDTCLNLPFSINNVKQTIFGQVVRVEMVLGDKRASNTFDIEFGDFVNTQFTVCSDKDSGNINVYDMNNVILASKSFTVS